MGLGGLKQKRENVVLLLYVIGLAYAMTTLTHHAGGPLVRAEYYWPNVRFYLLALIVIIAVYACILLARHRPPSPSRFFLHSEPANDFWRSVGSGLPLIMVIAIFMPSFSLVKATIPLLQPQNWDLQFIAIDRAIHGTDAWRLLQPFLGYPIVTSMLSKIYHLWFLLIFAGTIYVAVFVQDRTLRYRFFVTYLMMWTTGGMAMAVGFASVGPCFLEPLLGNDHFAEQMAYLNAANLEYPVHVLVIQAELIEWFRNGDYGFGRGISAMPSMHVALAFLFYLTMRRVSRKAGWFFAVFCSLIMVGSIHLGYHYAVDGYVSFALVAASWWLSGKIVPHLFTRSEGASPSPALTGVPANA